MVSDPNRPASASAGLREVLDALSGAPLDVIKTIAACLMVIDHVNYMFFGHGANWMWYVGRPVFPLFVFALVCNLVRGTKAPEYVARLILIGVVSQPFYATAIATSIGDVLFTLAVGAVVALALQRQQLLVQHATFFAAGFAIFASSLAVREGLDYGLAGMLLPAALFLVIAGHRSHIVWLVVFFVALNWFAVDTWLINPFKVACFAAAGATLIGLGSLVLRGRARFLPRYALHLFYPGHLAVLIAIRHFA